MHKRENLRWWLATAAGVAGIAITVALGMWQLGRAAHKQAWQTAVQQQSQAAALDAQAVRVVLQQAGANLQGLEHRKVHLQGQWLPEHTLYLDNRQMQGKPGFYVLTPLQLAQGDVVLVQRGWIARNFQQRLALQPIETPTGWVQIEGRMAPAPARTLALVDGDAPDAHNPQVRQNLDMPAWVQATGLSAWPLTVVQLGPASEGLLRDWPVVGSGISKHHGYAFQWFAMAAVLAILLLWFQFLRPARTDNSPHAAQQN